jgi:hypothetical protein
MFAVAHGAVEDPYGQKKPTMFGTHLRDLAMHIPHKHPSQVTLLLDVADENRHLHPHARRWP